MSVMHKLKFIQLEKWPQIKQGRFKPLYSSKKYIVLLTVLIKIASQFLLLYPLEHFPGLLSF